MCTHPSHTPQSQRCLPCSFCLPVFMGTKWKCEWIQCLPCDKINAISFNFQLLAVPVGSEVKFYKCTSRNSVFTLSDRNYHKEVGVADHVMSYDLQCMYVGTECSEMVTLWWFLGLWGCGGLHLHLECQ